LVIADPGLGGSHEDHNAGRAAAEHTGGWDAKSLCPTAEPMRRSLAVAVPVAVAVTTPVAAPQ
jgi:hypothetical protein